MKIEPFKLERYFAKYEFKAPYLLSSSDCESITIKELLSMEPGADEEFMKLNLGYAESEGHPVLREQIAGLYSNIDPDDILVPGTIYGSAYSNFRVGFGRANLENCVEKLEEYLQKLS